MFAIEMLPANHGDGLWLEYGAPGETRNVLIDGGPPYARPVIEERLARAGGRLELLVVTHVDFDHIGGIASLLARLPENTGIGDIWFNGWRHLPGPDDQLGAVQGEMVSGAIVKRGLPWNERFGREPVAVKPREAPPSIALPGGLRLTVLAPPVSALRALRPQWEREVREANMIEGDLEAGLAKLLERERLPDLLGEEDKWDPPKLEADWFTEDRSLANRSSIALLAEYEEHAILLAADSPPVTLLPGVRAVCEQRRWPRLRVDAAKLAHHGSGGSTSSELLDQLDCPRYLISTNGKIYHHPSLHALARTVLHGGPNATLLFNYAAPNAKRVDVPEARDEYCYDVVFPPAAETGLRVEL